MNLEQAIGQYHRAAADFSRGNSAPVKAVYSDRGDVSLANPFGPAVSGWQQVSAALDYAASRFANGDVIAFDRIATYEGNDLACILELESWRAQVAGRQEMARFDLRVTSTFRREEGAWKLVHRHADPITTPDPDGPLRGSNG